MLKWRYVVVETRLAASRHRRHTRLSTIINSMAKPECAVYKALKEREDRTHAAWTSFLYRNEVKPRLSEKAKRKHQKAEMEAYEIAHKARLAHAKTCSNCSK
jgi:hypothetical protein